MGRLVAALALLIACLCARGTAAAPVAVDLQLALAIDVSRSIDDVEAQLQRDGYINAFRNPEVIGAIRSGMLGRIAVGYFEWSGQGYIHVVANWTLIDGAAAAEAFATKLAASAPTRERSTSISGAIEFATPWFDGNGFDGARRVLDVSGDGPNNGGALVPAARDKALAAGLTINGLPILDEGRGYYSRFNIPNLDLYYRDCVIGGPGAFIVVAQSFKDFARAVRRKLILEIAGRRRATGPIPAAGTTRAQASPPCDIGEQLLRQRRDF